MITLQYNNDLSYDKWVSLRKDSIGASEVSAICFGSEYTSNVQIFYEKVTGIKKGIENVRTYIGKKSENIVDQIYPYYEGNDDSVHINASKGNILRKIENRNVTGKNSLFPHITATPDRFLLPFGIFKSIKDGIVEYKNTQSWVMKKYKPGLPLDNVVQLLTQLNVFELDYGELFYFIDNRRYELHPMEKKDWKSKWKIIQEITFDFWNKVKEARPIYNRMCEAKRTYNMKLAAELEHELQRLEPPIQHSQGYLNFINENFKSRSQLGSKEASAAAVEKAKRYADLGKKMDKLEKERLAIEIELKKEIGDATVLSLGKSGSITWQQYESRKIFKVNIK